MTRVGGFLGPPLGCFGHMICLICFTGRGRALILSFGVSALLCGSRLQPTSRAGLSPLGVVLFAFDYSGGPFPVGNRIYCFLDFTLLSSRYFVYYDSFTVSRACIS